jgi:putative transposase
MALARRTRVFVENVAQYVLLTTEHQDGMFQERVDFDFFIQLLQELSHGHGIVIHAYTLLQKSFEFLSTPQHEEALPKFMQILARRYIVYFNKKYQHTGSLWKHRYVSVLVDTSEYLYDVIKYIETKSRKLVRDEKSYLYSSIHTNIFDIDDAITKHNEKFSHDAYKNNYSSYLTRKKYNFITQCIERQQVIGDSEFIQGIEENIGVLLHRQKRGRPKKDINKQRKNMYTNLVVLNKEKHKNLKISSFENLLFAKEVVTLSLTYKEVAVVGKDFPVVFSNDEIPSFITLVSLGDTNLAITPDGKWITDYIPMAVLKYPFGVMQSGVNQDENIILIDESTSLLSKSKGKQLFKKSGEVSDTLQKAIKYVSVYDNQIKRTRLATQEIKQSGILEPKEIRVDTDGLKKALINGFSVVNQEKLANLDIELLARWEKNGIMELIKAHLLSLKNVNNLFTLAKNRQVQK